MTQRIEPSFGSVIIMIVVMNLSFAWVNRLAFSLVVVIANDLSLPTFIADFPLCILGCLHRWIPWRLLQFARHCRNHMHFQRVSRNFQGFIEFLVFRIDAIHEIHLSAFVDSQTLAICLCNAVSVCQDFLDISDHVAGHLFSGLDVAWIFVNHTQTTCILDVAYYSTEWTGWNPSIALIVHDHHRRNR